MNMTKGNCRANGLVNTGNPKLMGSSFSEMAKSECKRVHGVCIQSSCRSVVVQYVLRP